MTLREEVIKSGIVDEEDKSDLINVAVNAVMYLKQNDFHTRAAIDFVGNIINAVRDNYGD